MYNLAVFQSFCTSHAIWGCWQPYRAVSELRLGILQPFKAGSMQQTLLPQKTSRSAYCNFPGFFSIKKSIRPLFISIHGHVRAHSHPHSHPQRSKKWHGSWHPVRFTTAPIPFHQPCSVVSLWKLVGAISSVEATVCCSAWNALPSQGGFRHSGVNRRAVRWHIGPSQGQ